MAARIIPLTVESVEYVAHGLAQKTMTWTEPIPGFQTRFPNILESCLAVPFQSFGRKSFYPGLIGKAAILFYLMIKNHPFQNGNKRLAVTSLFVFLWINNHWLEVDNVRLYRFSVWIAESPAEAKDAVVAAVKEYLKNHIVSVT